MNIKKIISFILLMTGLLFISYFFFSNIPSNSVSFSNIPSGGNNGIIDDLSFKNIIKGIFNKDGINIVVFGAPGDGYIAGELTDSIILINLNSEKNKVSLISIPRDLWVSDAGNDFKINEVLKRDKIPFAMSLIKDITGFIPDGYVLADLSMLKDITDWLGGIDITLNEAAVDWVSGYTLDAGSHHLDGEDVIWLARNRYNKSGDFFRENNQQKIIQAIFEDVLSLSIDKKMEFANKFVFNSQILNNIDIDPSKIIPLVINGKMNEIRINRIVIDPKTKLFNITSVYATTSTSSQSISVVLPSAGEGNYDEIREYIQEKIK